MPAGFEVATSLRFDEKAAADRDGDGEITLAELGAMPVSAVSAPRASWRGRGRRLRRVDACVSLVRMHVLNKPALLALLSLGACGSSSEKARPTRDASDAIAQDHAPEADAHTRGESAAEASSDVDAAPMASSDAGGESVERFVYVGGWASGDYPFRSYAVDGTTFALTQVGSEENLGVNPSYCVGSSDGRHLYIANESWSGMPALTVAALGPDGAATRLDTKSLPGAGSPVFTSLTPDGAFVVAADIRLGQVFVLGLEDGRLGEIADTQRLDGVAGGGSAETHSAVVHPSGKWVYAPNKATDRIAQFALDRATGKLTPLSPALVAGEDEPRIIAIHPAGALAYVMHEKSSVLVGYRVGAGGTLTRLAGAAAVTRTTPADYTGANLGAHVLVHPSGKYLYASNRGHDSIAAFAIADDGALRLLGHTPSGGRIPRHFDVDARGELLVVANQGSDGVADGTLVAFAIGTEGTLTPRGAKVTGLLQPTSATIVTRTKR